MLDGGIGVHTVAAWHGHDPRMTYIGSAHPDEQSPAGAGAALALREVDER
jgi:hypothetical protein